MYWPFCLFPGQQPLTLSVVRGEVALSVKWCHSVQCMLLRNAVCLQMQWLCIAASPLGLCLVWRFIFFFVFPLFFFFLYLCKRRRVLRNTMVLNETFVYPYSLICKVFLYVGWGNSTFSLLEMVVKLLAATSPGERVESKEFGWAGMFQGLAELQRCCWENSLYLISVPLRPDRFVSRSL